MFTEAQITELRNTAALMGVSVEPTASIYALVAAMFKADGETSFAEFAADNQSEPAEGYGAAIVDWFTHAVAG